MDIVLFIIAVATFVGGLIKGVRGWRKARDEAIAARARQEDALERVLSQFKNNGGSSLVDKVDRGNAQIGDVSAILAAHVAAADDWFEKNTADHTDIHRRIDGLFELIAGRGQTEPRRMSDRHAARRTDEEG